MIRKIGKSNISEQVLQQIKDNIINNVWKRGEKIPSETELAESFGVSRNTVRAGIQCLSAIGMLKVVHGKGSMVADSIYDENFFNSIPSIELNETEWIELLNFRAIVEGALVKQAAINRNESELEELKRCAEEIIETCKNKNFDVCALADLRFHTCVAKASRNKTYYYLFTKMRDIWLSQQTMSKIIFDDYFDLHRQIYEAILNRDPESAHKYTVAHLKYRLDEEKQRLNIKT